MTIGQLARRAGVGVETIRFYEREGLVDRPGRTPSGYRQYDAGAVRRIRFIRHARDLGFSLREIGELLSLRADPRRSCRDVREKALARVADLDARLRALRRMRRVMVRLIAACDERRPTSECPILEALGRDGGDG